MILYYSYNELKFTTKGKIHNSCKLAHPLYKVKCEKCDKIFKENSKVFEKRLSLINKEYCGKCARPLMASLAGIKGTYNEDGSLKENSGRFSRARVDAMNNEEYEIYKKQRKNATKVLHDKLNSNPELKEEHYKKVFKNSRIGYISRAQRDIANILAEDGFLLEQYVEGLMCDIVNFEKKVVIEYNGDLFHANPRKYNPDDYIDIIRMTAKEKWKKDYARNFRLRSCGWDVIIIWENEWINNRENILEKLKTFKDENWIVPKWWEIGETTKYKAMKNIKTNKNKYVLLSEVDNHTIDGWELGFISRKKEEQDETIKN